MKICLIGTHGVGKTTLLNALKQRLPQYAFKREVVRRLLERNPQIKINERGNYESQNAFIDACIESLSHDDAYISDRGIIDYLAYSCHLRQHDNMTQEQYDALFHKCESFLRINDDIVYFYIPIEFGIDDDGTRPVDVTYQREIDDIIKMMIIQFGINVYELRGDVETRVNKLVNFIEHQNKKQHTYKYEKLYH